MNINLLYCSLCYLINALSLSVDIIVVAVLLAVLVFILMTAIIVCVIFALGARRKSSRKGMEGVCWQI